MTTSTKTGLKILFASAAVFAVLASGHVKAQEACNEQTGTFVENFDTADYKEAGTSVAEWPSGPIRLNKSGGNFGLVRGASPGLGGKLLTAAAGPYTGDGYPDLVGFNSDSDSIILVTNEFRDNDGDGLDDDGSVFRVDHGEQYGSGGSYVVDDPGFACLVSGDFNGDGKTDFFFLKDRVLGANPSADYRAFMFVNRGTTTDPDFADASVSVTAPNLDFSAKLRSFSPSGLGTSYSIAPNGLSRRLFAVNIDPKLDNDIDILAVSGQYVFLLKNPGPAQFNNLAKWDIRPLESRANRPLSTGFTGPHGTCSVAAADFDNDGDVEVVSGSLDAANYLCYFDSDGAGYYKRQASQTDIVFPAEYCPALLGPMSLFAADFNGDGRPDLVGATDPTYIPGNQAQLWWLKNLGVDAHGNVQWALRWLNAQQPVCPPGYDVDVCAILDVNKDGKQDVLIADAEAPNTDYYIAMNGVSDVYALQGIATSKDCTAGLDATTQVITRCQVTRLDLGSDGGSSAGLAVKLEVSADDGVNWEEYGTYADTQLVNQVNLPIYEFKNYGKHLRWRATLTASDDLILDAPNASYETPTVGQIDFTYWYVDRREYARSSLVAATVEVSSGVNRKLIFAGTFIFPGWEGHLRAYDVTDVVAVDSANTVLRTVSRSTLPEDPGRTVMEGSSIRWDAGTLLNGRSADSRVIYTAIDVSGTLTRTDFTAANATTLGPILNDPNNDAAGLINFVRGVGRTWKLGDIDHSTPVMVGPPSGSADQMGAGYATYKEARADRIKVLYVGANDGMLHAFDARDGNELWAYVPGNLLPRLREMWPVNATTGQRVLARKSYVDGSPISADVFIGGAWKTVLICGQGRGKGSLNSGGLNYYFALDITDPYAPTPLWEFTDYTEDNAMGESWSVPVVGKVLVDDVATWVAFMGSGYNNDPAHPAAGKTFYGVRIEDGLGLLRHAVGETVTTPNINNVLVASPSAIDTDLDGLLDRVYAADLDGHVYSVNVDGSWSTAHSNGWSVATIYTDSRNYPIASKPLAWMDVLAGLPVPRVYFGTGGDDAAPSTGTYSFVCVMDDLHSTVEWYLGDPDILGLPAEACKGSLAVGEKVWADPVIPVGDGTCYFSTLAGNIENVNPCLNFGAGKLYGRWIQSRSGATIGGSVFKNATTGEVQASLDLASKARRAVTVGDRETTASGVQKRDIYLQEYDSTIQKIEQAVGSRLKVKSWREVYKILR